MLSLVWVDLILDMWLQQLHRVLVVFGDKAQCQIFFMGLKIPDGAPACTFVFFI